LHNELYNQYPSPNIGTVTKSRRMGWAGHTESMRRIRNHYTLFGWKISRKEGTGEIKAHIVSAIKMDRNEIGCLEHGKDSTSSGYSSMPNSVNTMTNLRDL
jgi:hypothetical protein